MRWLDAYRRTASSDLDFVITVCGKVADETPPAWSGDPYRTVWNLKAPGSHEGTDEEIRAAFSNTCDAIEASVRKFLAIPFDQLTRDEICERLREAGPA
jgi:arsenate reductase